MDLTLHRFALSHFSEKARVSLVFKGLAHRIVDHRPGLDQWEIYRLTGQRKLPVLEHDGMAIADSTAIAMHLEHAFPGGVDGRRAMLPDDFAQRRAVLDLEDRIDAALGMQVPTVAFDHALRDAVYFNGYTHATLGVSGAARVGLRVAGVASRPALWLPRPRATVTAARKAVRDILQELCDRLKDGPFLCGDVPTLADLAAVGLSLPLEFPAVPTMPEASLRGVGVTEYVRDPVLSRFFDWRRRFYRETLGEPYDA